MRKLKFLILLVVVSLISTVTNAQVEETEEIKTEVQEKATIQANDLPDAVAVTLKEKYAEYNIDKALKTEFNNKKAFYVLLSKGEESIKILIDVEGNIYNKEEEEDDEK